MAGPPITGMSSSLWGRVQITSGALDIVENSLDMLGGTRANALNITTATDAALALNITNTNTGSSAASQVALFTSSSFAQSYLSSETNSVTRGPGTNRWLLRTNAIRGIQIVAETGSIDIGVDGDRTILAVTTASITANEVTSSTMVVSGIAVRISGSTTVTGSLLVSGSSAFTNIGPARVTGSVNITGSLFLNNVQIQPLNSASFILVGDVNSNQRINGSLNQGYLNATVGAFTTALGSGSVAVNTASYAEGIQTVAGGDAGHAEGYGTVAGVQVAQLTGTDSDQYFVAESTTDITTLIQDEDIWYLFDNSFITTALILRAYDTGTTVAFFNGTSGTAFDTMSTQVANQNITDYVDSTAGGVYTGVQVAGTTVEVQGDVTGTFNNGDAIRLLAYVGDGLKYGSQVLITSNPTYNDPVTTFEINTGPTSPYTNVDSIVKDTDLQPLNDIPVGAPQDTVIVNGVQPILAGTTAQILNNITYYPATFGSSYAVSQSTAYYTITSTAPTNAFTNVLLATTSASYAHAEGYQTTALGLASHAEGRDTITYSPYSHAGGLGTIASGSAQTAIGKYNIADSQSLFIVGGGTDNSNRSNLLTVDSNRTTIGNGLTLKSNYDQSVGTVNLSLSSSLLFIGNGVHTVVLPPTSTVPNGSIFYIKADPESGTGRFAITSSGGDYIDSGGRTKYAITASGAEKPCIQLAVGTPGYWGILSVWNGVTSSVIIG